MAEWIVSTAAISQQRFESNNLIGHRCISEGSEHRVTCLWIWKQRQEITQVWRSFHFHHLLFIEKTREIHSHRERCSLLYVVKGSEFILLWECKWYALEGSDSRSVKDPDHGGARPPPVQCGWTHIHSFCTAPSNLAGIQPFLVCWETIDDYWHSHSLCTMLHFCCFAQYTRFSVSGCIPLLQDQVELWRTP